MRILSLIVIFASIFVSIALAESTISCHCFRDRAFDPQNAYAADPYFLATTQNALLANLFGLRKKDVVEAKMGGANGDRLWIGHYLAQISNQSHAEIEALYSEKNDWSEVVKALQLDLEQLGPRFVASLSDQKKLAMVVVDEQLVAHLDVAPEKLQRLREQGAGNQQAVMAIFLAQSSVHDSSELFAKVAGGKDSWGKLLSEQGFLHGSEIEDKWKQLLKQQL